MPGPVKKNTSVPTEDLIAILNQVSFNDVYDESRCPGMLGAMSRVLTALVESGATGKLGYPSWDLVKTARGLTVCERERVADEAAEAEAAKAEVSS